MRRSLLLPALVFTLAAGPFAGPALAQSTASAPQSAEAAAVSETVTGDAVASKLFFAPTGRVMKRGEVYVAVESPRGELGCYLVSDGSAKPWRMHIRGPSFIHLQCLPHMMHGGLIADAVAVISSVDPVLGGVDR